MLCWQDQTGELVRLEPGISEILERGDQVIQEAQLRDPEKAQHIKARMDQLKVNQTYR